MNQTLIARLAAGEIAAENNGTLEQLREVLKAAFPEDGLIETDGRLNYYHKSPDLYTEYVEAFNTSLPTVPITDFFTPYNHDRAVELLRELVRTFHRKFMEDSIDKDDWNKRVAEKNAAFATAEQFLNELNKEK